MAPLQLSDWDDVGELIEQALAAPPEVRDHILQNACGTDTERLSRARVTLAAAARAESFLSRPAAAVATDLLRSGVDADEPLTHVGAYRIVELIGRGGMGDVYLAERADDEFQRRVAVKVVRPGLGADLVARFVSERQVLASLDHPNIAQLHDGGVASDGRPFLVMEYVQGRPLDAYADEQRLGLERRLDLFLQVCDAVERAHRRLVVHRDLKPGNVLVTSEGTAKLLDFGVAKLMDPRADAMAAPATRVGVRMMTPEYGSPEQLLGEPTTTATDIYSLGVMLYELLSGRRPYEDAERDAAALERRVLDGHLTAPSVACRVATTRSDAASRARARGLSIDGLSRALAGDLDTIVATALRREPDRRYGSVATLRQDIERHRAGLPISARPLTLRYRTAKFVRRHRVAVAAAAIVVVALGAGVAGTLIQARAAAREGQRAALIRDFLVGVFENSDPDRSRGETVTARTLLDRGSDRIRRELSGDPELRADVLGVLGNLYYQLGVFDRAREHLEEALTLRRNGSASREQLITSLSTLASVRHESGAPDEAEKLLREALDLARAPGAAMRAAEAGVLSDLAAVHRARGQFDAAEGHAREALAMRRELGEPAGLADTLNGLGMTLHDGGKATDAIAALEEGLRLARQAYGEDHTKTVLVQCNVAMARHRAGQVEAALGDFRVCVDARRRLLGGQHPYVGLALNNMGLVYADRNEYDDAERVHLEALRIQRAAYGERHREVAATLNNLAILEYRRSRYVEAAQRFRELTVVWSDLLGPTHPDTLTSMNNLGMTLRNAGELEEAETVLAGVVEGRTKALGRDHPEVANTIVNLASIVHRRSNFPRARDLAAQALPMLERAHPADHPLIGVGLVVLGRAQLGAGDARAALASLDRAIAIDTKVYGVTHLQTCEARVARGQALAALGRTGEARSVIESAIADLVAGKQTGSQTYKYATVALGALGGRVP
jgi:eukaryotic-like serine/threonine-protein kinase